VAEGAFNVAAPIRRLGLKNARDMPVTERIQPTISVGNLADLTPATRPPANLYAGLQGAVALLQQIVEVRSLGPGGCYIDELWFGSAFTAAVAYVAASGSIVGAPVVPVMVLSNEARISEVRVSNILPTGRAGVFLSGVAGANPFFFSERGWFIPRGVSFYMEANVINAGDFRWGVGVRDVPATEFVPS